jgi:hypothetical protein
MNHNIRYELRDPSNLEVSIEISQTQFGSGAGAVGPDGVGVDGLNVSMEVFNIDKRLWWYNGPNNNMHEWTALPPNPGAVANAADHIDNYQWPLSNALLGLGGPHSFPFEGLYTSHGAAGLAGGLTSGYSKLRGGSGEEPNIVNGVPAHDWDKTWVENNFGQNSWNAWSGWTGQSGFFIRITALNGVGDSIVEFLHLMPLAISYYSVAPGAIHAGDPAFGVLPALAPGAIYAGDTALSLDPAIAPGAIHAGDGAPGTEAIAPGAIHAGDLLNNIVPAIATDAITADQIADDAITADQIADDAITADQIADDAITADQIADDAITADQIADDAITADQIADDAITADQIADDAITADQIADDAITADQIADDAITADQIGANAIMETAFDDEAISARVIAAGAIHAGDGNPGTEAIATDAIGADQIADYAIHDKALAGGAIHKDGGPNNEPAIEESAIHDTALATNSIHAMALAPGAIHAGDGNPGTEAIAPGAIHDASLAENAINENAVKIDSVTYEEISNSAIREIVSGIWNADIFHPIDVSPDADFSGATFGGANKGSVGHAILLQYISQNILHWDNADNALTPLHKCSHDDAAGTRFYSETLSAAGEDKAKGYIGKAAVVIKNWSFDTPPGGNEEFYLVRITAVGNDAHGDYFDIHMADEDQSPIPSGGLASGTDALIVKEETDATMHEVAHEVWEESVLDHETSDTFGMLNRVVAGLSQFNHQITDSTYDKSGRLLACRLVVYSSSEDARNGVNPLTTIEVTSAYDEKQNMTTFTAAEESQE